MNGHFTFTVKATDSTSPDGPDRYAEPHAYAHRWSDRNHLLLTARSCDHILFANLAATGGTTPYSWSDRLGFSPNGTQP